MEWFPEEEKVKIHWYMDPLRKSTIYNGNGVVFGVASQEGFEPPAYGLEVRCSIQLSYWDNYMERVMGIEPTYPAWKAGALPLSYTRLP